LRVKQEAKVEERTKEIATEQPVCCQKPEKKRWLAVLLAICFSGFGLLYIRSCLNREQAGVVFVLILMSVSGVLFAGTVIDMCAEIMFFAAWGISIIIAIIAKLN